MGGGRGRGRKTEHVDANSAEGERMQGSLSRGFGERGIGVIGVRGIRGKPRSGERETAISDQSRRTPTKIIY